MFTGIIEELGTIERFEKPRKPALISVRAEKVTGGLEVGDSVAVNGVCLTVIKVKKGGFSAEAISETLDKTTLSGIKSGEKVNLEGSLKAGSRIGGHFVTGHVDGAGTIISKKTEKGQTAVEIKSAVDIIDMIVMKGSVAVDGVSLTVAGVKAGSFLVYLIPHTAESTTLGFRQPGDSVNIETDMLGKYALKRTAPEKTSVITEKFLRDKGFI